jgi:hypothetical protein
MPDPTDPTPIYNFVVTIQDTEVGWFTECSGLTVERGVLWDWFRTGWYDGKVERRHVTITLLNPDHTEARHWDMTNAYPVRWNGPDFQADSAQVGVETLELVSGGGAEQSVVQRALNEAANAVSIDRAVPQAAEIDLTLLAEKVVALMKQELSIERERLGRKWS